MFIKTFVTSSSNSTTWGIIMHFHKDCDLEEWIPLFLYGKTHDVARQNCSNLSISKSTIRRVLPIFFFILYLQKGYNSLHDVVMCQTTLFLQKNKFHTWHIHQLPFTSIQNYHSYHKIESVLPLWSFKSYPLKLVYVCMPTPFNSLKCTWCPSGAIVTSSQHKVFLINLFKVILLEI